MINAARRWAGVDVTGRLSASGACGGLRDVIDDITELFGRLFAPGVALTSRATGELLTRLRGHLDRASVVEWVDPHNLLKGI